MKQIVEYLLGKSKQLFFEPDENSSIDDLIEWAKEIGIERFETSMDEKPNNNETICISTENMFCISSKPINTNFQWDVIRNNENKWELHYRYDIINISIEKAISIIKDMISDPESLTTEYISMLKLIYK